MNNLGLLEITEWETWSKPIKYQFVRFCPFVGPPSDCCRWICAVLLRVNRHYQNCYCSLRTFSDLALVFFVISLVSFYLQICWTEGVSLMRNRFLCEANCDQIRLRRHPCSVLMLCSGSMYHRSEKRLWGCICLCRKDLAFDYYDYLGLFHIVISKHVAIITCESHLCLVVAVGPNLFSIHILLLFQWHVITREDTVWM